MNIRTVTVGAREDDLARAAAAAHAARERLQADGYVVQTLRLALALVGSNRCGDLTTIVRGAEDLALEHGFDMVSIGRVDAERLPHLAEALAATSAVSAGVRIAGRDGAPDPLAIAQAAEAVVALGRGTPRGFGNFRLAALACVGPGSPFFPAAYHDGGRAWLAVGPEAAALALEATAEGAAGAPQRLTALIEGHDRRIRAALDGLGAAHGVFVSGCDWSLAPSPARSIGAAIEVLSGAPFGELGTLAAVRALTEAIRAARVDQLGFSGVMLPVLEDAVIAQRGREGRYRVRDLLAFSAVCGTGLDTLPVPGDATAAQIGAALREVAALAGALRKPLTARLMPMPGRAAGDLTGLDFGAEPQLAAFLCEARVLAL